jgi:hypothetical protein
MKHGGISMLPAKIKNRFLRLYTNNTSNSTTVTFDLRVKLKKKNSI